ncbi:putative ATP-dependent RNA helicase DEAD-box, LPPG:FO 2-phospho-L-lactate transferase CofD/UPF0052 [Plasmopara halstedii]
MASRAFRQAHSQSVPPVECEDNVVSDKLKQNERERLEIERLESRIAEQTPARGSQLGEAASFDLFALSEASRRGLRSCGFSAPTKIQIGALPHALAGRDVLAAAKTGSGKTLAFLLPVLEKLFRLRWSVEDGLGALIISPTRELALQIFEVLRNVGKAHTFSAGLVIGGKNFREEQLRLIRMNLLVCTPGRLLQHMEQTPAFDSSNLQVLVLDEADRILDLGFQKQLTAILEHLPPAGERQTMLFSATQTKSVKDLAALSLRQPEYVAVHEHSANATPKGLQQSYVVTPLERKLDVLLSFIKSHLKQKTIVFLSTCRQVRFIHSVFCKLQPGIPLCALHGKYKQGKRVEVYYEFLNKPAAVLFATDIAARGLDFPQVDWVLQLDCPEDAANYIHRVGRTARYNKQGKALMCLVPSEVDGITKRLEDAKVPIRETKLNPAKSTSCHQKVASVVAGDKEIKALAQKAFMSYVRSVYLQPDREVFDATALALDAYAESLGLPGAPRMPFLSKMKDEHEKRGNEALREELRGKKNVNRKLQQLKEKIKAEKERKRLARQLVALNPTNKEVAKNIMEKNEKVEEDDEDEDSLMVVKRVHHWDDESEPLDKNVLVRNKKKQKKLRVDPEVINASKIVFDEDGNGARVADRLAARFGGETEFADVEQHAKAYTEQVAARLAAKDAEDRRLEKERVRAKHHKKRLKNKGERGHESEDEGACLVVDSDDEDMSDKEVNNSNDEMADSSDDDDDNVKKNNIDRQAVARQEEVALRLLQCRSAKYPMHRRQSGMREPKKSNTAAMSHPRHRRIRAVAMILDDVLYDHSKLLSHLAIERGIAQLLAEDAFLTAAAAFEALQTFRNAYGLRKRFPRFVDSLVQSRLSPIQAQRVIKAYYESNVPEAQSITPFPGVRKALLNILRDGEVCQLALLLIGKPDVQRARLQALGVDDLFHQIVHINSNPSLAQLISAVEQLARQLQVPPSAVMFVGRKAFYEIKAANTVGMLTVRMHFGKYASVMPTDEMEQSNYQIESIEQLVPIVKLANQQILQPKIVAIGGGTGLAVLLKELRHYPAELTAVVTVFDSGRHSGSLRKCLGILPPGDIRNCLVALSDSDELMSKLMNYRFQENFMEGCSLGNLLLAALTDLQGGFDRAISTISDILKINGSVLPATLESTELCAELMDGSVVTSEVNVRSPFMPDDDAESRSEFNLSTSSPSEMPSAMLSKPAKERVRKAPIKRVYLQNQNVEAYLPAVRAIEDADIIILSPGGFYTSIVANLLVPGIRDAIVRSTGATVYISNVTTQNGQTDGYTLEKTLEELSKYLGANAIDYVIANNTKPPKDTIAPYLERGEELLLPTPGMTAMKHPVLIQGQIYQENLAAGRVVREWNKTPMLKHSGSRVAAILYSIIDKEMAHHRQDHQSQIGASRTELNNLEQSVTIAPVIVCGVLAVTILLASVFHRR